MKKLFAIFLALMMTVILVSCGDKQSGTDNEESSAKSRSVDTQKDINDVVEEAADFESFSVEAVEYYLEKNVDIKLSQLEPQWEWVLKNDYCAYGDNSSYGYGHAVIKFTKAEGEVTTEEYDAWYDQVFRVTAEASQDGFNIRGYEFAGEGEDALGEVTLDEALEGWLMKGWAFRYNDKIYVVYVSDDYDKEKESPSGNLFYYDSVEIDIGVGLQKSWDDTLGEMEEYMEENEEEIEKAINDYLN